jgi:hypothetical protein
MVFFVWVPLLVAVGASLMVSHLYALPRPATGDTKVAEALNSLRKPNEQNSWLAVHVLYAECRCSQRIVKHLASRKPLAGVSEKLLLVGENSEYLNSAIASGFDARAIRPRELESTYHLTAAPLLVVLDPAGNVRYLGGYTERKQGPDIRDVAVIQNLMRGERAAELPLFGCAVSKKLQAMLDPFGLKYKRGVDEGDVSK